MLKLMLLPESGALSVCWLQRAMPSSPVLRMWLPRMACCGTRRCHNATRLFVECARRIRTVNTVVCLLLLLLGAPNTPEAQ